MKKTVFLFLFTLAAKASFGQELKFELAQSVDETFRNSISVLNFVSSNDLNGGPSVEVYKEAESEEDGPEWSYQTFIKIDTYFFNSNFGLAHSIKIQDIAGNDNVLEVAIRTGCYSDGGCGEKLLIIRTFANQPFSITDFGESTIVSNIDELYDEYGVSESKYTRAAAQTDLQNAQKNGEFVTISSSYDNNSGKCYFVIKSFKLSTNGFAKGTLSKKISSECAG
jgi:hypothetical protein